MNVLKKPCERHASAEVLCQENQLTFMGFPASHPLFWAHGGGFGVNVGHIFSDSFKVA
jgi:hypothetical protein